MPALSGNAAEAIRQLDRLLQSGEASQALFGPISWSLRRFASATRIFQRAERRGQPMRLPEALEQAGFFKWQREAMQAAERQLKQLGRERQPMLPRWLLDTDLALKGSHSSPDMARLALEQLLAAAGSEPGPAARVGDENRRRNLADSQVLQDQRHLHAGNLKARSSLPGEESRGLVVADDLLGLRIPLDRRGPAGRRSPHRWQVFIVCTWLKTSETGSPPSRMQR